MKDSMDVIRMFLKHPNETPKKKNLYVLTGIRKLIFESIDFPRITYEIFEIFRERENLLL